jgi:glycosyltransferase involved in cell wall biosynthesis
VRFSVIIPTLDEADRIGTLVTALKGENFDEVIVVDGGSRDATVARAASAGATVVTSARGRGRQLGAGAPRGQR